MPELPEVEVIRRGLAPVLVGRRFLAVKVGAKRLRQQSSPAELRRWVLGRRLEGLRRRGKYLLFDLEGGVTLLIHLGMTGRLLTGPPPSPPLPHVHLVFQLEGGLELSFQDTRRFGQVLVFPPGVAPPPLAQVGAEPFSRQVTPAWLAEQARGRRRPIKNFLLDARILAGIGNIYACEILFAARLHPATPVASLTLDGLGPGAHRDPENPQARHQERRHHGGQLSQQQRRGRPLPAGAPGLWPDRRTLPLRRPHPAPGPGRAQQLFLSGLPAAEGLQSLTHCPV